MGSICSSNVAFTVTTSPLDAINSVPCASACGELTDTVTSAAVRVAGGVLSFATHTLEPGWS